MLRAPPGSRTRPTSDRVREAMFDVLGSVLGADGLQGADVVDLFAGSGALGIEALSRGAASAVFVERDRRAAAAVSANLSALGMSALATVVQADAVSWLAGPGGEHAFGLAFCDPPYVFDGWAALLGRLRAEVAVLESDRPLELPASWNVLKTKRYGGTLVTVVQVATSPGAAPRCGTAPALPASGHLPGTDGECGVAEGGST